MVAIDRWIEHWADQRGNHPAVVFEGESVTYAELWVRTRTMAWLLADSGTKAGDRVAFCGLNRVEQLTALFACARLGALFVPLNNRLSVGEHAFMLGDCRPTVALATDGFETRLREAAPGIRVIDLDATTVATSGPTPPRVGDAADPLLMVYTSGTTGKPKGAVHTQSSLTYTVLNGVAHQDLDVTDRVLTFLPLFHVGGMNIQTLPALYVGATVVLQRRFDPTETLGLINTHQPTQSLAVPATMTALLNHPDINSTNLGSLHGLNSGSSVVPDHLIQGFADRGVRVGQVYGSTETGPTAIVLRYEDGATHVGSCGKPALHTELRVVGTDGIDLPEGDAGEIWLRGPNIFSHYWEQPDATADTFVDGWYRTGDIGRVDAQGFVYIQDRLKDLLISGGENVYPAEVENVITEMETVAEAAVIGRADERWGEVPIVALVPVDGAPPPSLADVRAWCDGRLARYKHPHEVRVVESLPRTALGKVQKHILRDSWVDPEVRP